MSVREPKNFRKTLLAGAVALALAGTGVAFAGAAGHPAPPSHPQGAPGLENRKSKPGTAQRPQHLHSESVVKKADGTLATELNQRGTVDAVSATSITVKSEDGYSQTYAVNGETKITQVPAAADGPSAMPGAAKRAEPTAGTIADIAAGDVVRISAEKTGGGVTAERIVEGAGGGPGLRPGRGQGHGKGHGK